MILNGRDTGGELFEEHLATHGFVMVEVHSPDFYGNWDFGLIDHPRDMLFTLDQIASNPPDGLKGVIDSDHVGVSVYSSEGYNALALS
jgi:predicted dienelactone hydrolase